jgi:hypothetical protein
MTELEKAVKARDAAIKLLAQRLKKKPAEVLKSLEEDKEEEIDEALNDYIDDVENTAINEGKKALKGELGKALKKGGYTKKFDKFDELVTDLKDSFKGEAGEDKDESEELAKLKTENKELKTKLSTKDQELEEEKAKLDKTHKQEIVKLGLKSHLKALVKELNGKEPTEADKADAKLQKMLKGEGINDIDWAWDEKRKDYVAIDEDGNPKRDNGQIQTLKGIVSNNIEYYYDILPAEKKDDGGLPDDKGGTGGTGGAAKFEFKHFKGQVPKNREDVDKVLDDPMANPDVQTEVQTYWETVGSKAAEQK